MKALVFLSLLITYAVSAQTPLQIGEDGALSKSDYDLIVQKYDFQALSSYDTLCDNPLAVRSLFIKENKYGLIDECGEVVTKHLYDWIGWVFNGHRGSQSLVVRDYRYGIIDARGIEILPCQFIRIRPSSSDSVFAVIQDGDDWVPNNAINDPSWKYIQLNSDGEIVEYLPPQGIKLNKAISEPKPIVNLPQKVDQEKEIIYKEYQRRANSQKFVKHNHIAKSIVSAKKIILNYTKISGKDTSVVIKPSGRKKDMRPEKSSWKGKEIWKFDYEIVNDDWLVFAGNEETENGNDLFGVYQISKKKIIVPPKYSKIECTPYGILAYVRTKKRRMYFLESSCYDYDGNLQITQSNSSMNTEFRNFYFPSHNIDILGQFLFVLEYDTLSSIYTKITYTTTIYNSDFEKVIPYSFKNNLQYYMNEYKPYLIAQNSNGDEKYGVFDLNGKIILNFEFDTIEEDFSIWKGDRCFKTKKDDQVSFYDYTGDLVFESTYSEIIEMNKATGREDWCLTGINQRCGRDMFYFEKGDKWGLLDSSLNVVMPAIYDKIGCSDFGNGLMYVQQGDRIGVYDFYTDSFAIPMDYTKIAKAENGLWYLYKNGFVGLYDLENHSFVLPIEYKKITYSKDGYSVTKDGRHAFLGFDTIAMLQFNDYYEFTLEKIYKGLWIGSRRCLSDRGYPSMVTDSKFTLNTFLNISELPKTFKVPLGQY